MQLAWSNVSNWRKTSVKHMVDAFEAARLFHGHQTVRLLNHADHRMVSARGRTKPAGINLRQVVTDRTENNTLFHFAQRGDQSFEIRFRRAHDMERQTLRRFVSNTRQTLQFVDEFGYWFRVLQHR